MQNGRLFADVQKGIYGLRNYYTVCKRSGLEAKRAEIFLLIPFGAVSLTCQASAFLRFYSALKKGFATLLRVSVDKSWFQVTCLEGRNPVFTVIF